MLFLAAWRRRQPAAAAQAPPQPPRRQRRATPTHYLARRQPPRVAHSPAQMVKRVTPHTRSSAARQIHAPCRCLHGRCARYAAQATSTASRLGGTWLEPRLSAPLHEPPVGHQAPSGQPGPTQGPWRTRHGGRRSAPCLSWPLRQLWVCPPAHVPRPPPQLCDRGWGPRHQKTAHRGCWGGCTQGLGLGGARYRPLQWLGAAPAAPAGGRARALP